MFASVLVPLSIVSSDPCPFNHLCYTCYTRVFSDFCSVQPVFSSQWFWLSEPVMKRTVKFIKHFMTQYLNISISGESSGLQKWEGDNGKQQKMGREMRSEWVRWRNRRTVKKVITPRCSAHLYTFNDSHSEIWMMIEVTSGSGNGTLNIKRSKQRLFGWSQLTRLRWN